MVVRNCSSDQGRLLRGRDGGDPGRTAGYRPRLASFGRKPPDAGGIVVFAAWAGALGDEQKGTVRGEHGGALTLFRSGESPGGPVSLGVERPQRRDVAAAVSVEFGHGGHEAVAVPGQHQPGQPGQAEVAVEICESPSPSPSPSPSRVGVGVGVGHPPIVARRRRPRWRGEAACRRPGPRHVASTQNAVRRVSAYGYPRWSPSMQPNHRRCPRSAS